MIKMTKEKNNIITILIILVIIFFATTLVVKKETSYYATFLWNSLRINAQSNTNFVGAGDSCSSWGGIINPITDNNGSLQARAYTSAGQCNNGNGGASFDIIIPNPHSYKQIFIKLNGYVSAGGSISSNCASASSTSSLGQEGSGSITLFSNSISCQGTVGLPSGILFNFDGDFISIPSLSTVYQMKNDNDLVLSFSLGSGSSANARSAESILNLESIDITYIPYTYSQFITAKNNYLNGGSFSTFITEANKWIQSA